MRHFHIICGICVFIILHQVVVAQETCSAITKAALEKVNVVCDEMEIDQICYGNMELEVEIIDAAGEYTFEEPGDILGFNQLHKLQLSPMDEEREVWGIAMMQLRINVPNTAPGQGVIFLLFGDVSFENREANLTTLPITSTGNINVRSGPSTDFAVVGSLPNGQTFNAFGRNQAGDWLQVRLDASSVGWVYAPLMSVAGDIETLTIAEAGSEAGVQAYYFRTGIGDAPCEEAPNSGILVRSPEDVREISLTFNEVEVSFGSTLFMQAEPVGELNVSVLEGHASLRAFGEEQTALEGTRVSVPLNNQLEAAGPPSLPQPCASEDLENLPVEHWQCEWVEVHLGDWFQECPATIPAGMGVLISHPLMEGPYSEAQIDSFIASGSSTILIDGEAVSVTRSKYGEGNDFGYDTHYYWETPEPGVYAIRSVNEDDTFSCELTILAKE